MDPSRQVICPARLRRVPPQFSWIDQRLVRERHLERIDVYACALYLFLVTVADAQGLSWYGDNAITRRLHIDEIRLARARADLVQAGLLAYCAPLYQVLSLDMTAAPRAPASAPGQMQGAPAAGTAGRIDARAQLAALHATLAKRS